MIASARGREWKRGPAREQRGDQKPDRRGDGETLVRAVEQRARRGERVKPEEARGGQERQRDQEQPRVRAPHRDAAGGVRERGADGRGAEHQPEVGGRVLPLEVGAGRREQQDEAAERDGESHAP
jgi:hypothetical protein